VRSRIHSTLALAEASDFSEELREIFSELDQAPDAEPLVGECAPALDLRETDEGIEVAMDLPGVQASAIRIVAKGGALLIAGRKAPRRWQSDASFHLVERAFGRFARTLRLPSPCDATRAKAVLRAGELRVTVPRVAERRGRLVPIRVDSPEA
jgi:HSP20 family protein